MRTASKSLFSLFFSIALLPGFGGCSATPANSAIKRFIDDELLAQVSPGETSRKELQQVLGEPDWSFEDGERWIYKARSSSADAKPEPEFEFVEYRFDDDSVVLAQDEFSILSGTCSESDRCYHRTDNALTIFASSDADDQAKQFLAVPGQCALYVYSDESFNAIDIHVDATGTTQRFRANDGYARLDLDEGLQTITLSYSSILNQASHTEYINCDAGTVQFLREQHDAHDTITVDIVAKHEGRNAVLERRLVMLPDPGTRRPVTSDSART